VNGLHNVRVIHADALQMGLEKNACDVVHERLILINLPPASQEALLIEMYSLLKPGPPAAVLGDCTFYVFTTIFKLTIS